MLFQLQKTDICFILMMAVLILLIVLMIRRVVNIRRTRRLSVKEKVALINDVAGKFGYEYCLKQDAFLTKLDAWQRKFGYEALFDRAAIRWNMIISCFPVYFDYQGRTWLLEFWKGQYGITVGSEIGIYHADHIVAPKDYAHTHYDSATNEELLNFGVHMIKKGMAPVCIMMPHWWLGVFRVGKLARPKQVETYFKIEFPDNYMKEAFLNGLQRAGYPMSQVESGCYEVTIRNTTENALKKTIIRKIRNFFARIIITILCVLYWLYTLPFKSTLNRLTFLYYSLPFAVRHLLTSRHYQKGKHKRK